ncbi:GNAT family N-acetyltransferase [Actinacidiphila glaucinigra]|uniref:GNAT family N-acetyltransferase n=1 Tax=Actinacidiphila glaucinigra TaxID=235986 RepID=UPI0036770EE7
MPKNAPARARRAAAARTASTRAHRPATVRIEAAVPADTHDYFELLMTALPDSQLDVPEMLLHLPPMEFTHGPALCLVARDTRTGNVVGALLGAVPVWIDEHPLTLPFTLPGVLLGALMADNIAETIAVAVDPAHRRQGIARNLITTAEQHFRDAGFKLAALHHAPALADFYARLGYHSCQRLLILTPSGDMFGQGPKDGFIGAKPLRPSVDIVTMPHAPGPIVTGLFRGCVLPPGTRFEDNRLILP